MSGERVELRGKVLSGLCKALGLTTGSTKKKRKLTIKSLYSLSSKLAFLLKNKGGGSLTRLSHISVLLKKWVLW